MTSVAYLRRLSFSMLLLATVACMGATDSMAQAAPTVQVTVRPVAASFAATDAVRVRVTFANRGARVARLPLIALPQGALVAPLFAVGHGGGPVTYVGPDAKFTPAAVRTSVLLAPGASLTRIADLTGAYGFTRSGRYAVRYAAAGLHSKAVAFMVAGHPASAIVPAARTAAFTSCTTDQQGIAGAALVDARTYAGKASAYMQAGTSSAPGARFQLWFGGVGTSTPAALPESNAPTVPSASTTAERWDTIKANYADIVTAMDGNVVTFNCSGASPCAPTTYAYVYPNAPYTVYLCAKFWTAPATGNDSRAGTLVHELTHFTVIAGTQDYWYGKTKSKLYASSLNTVDYTMWNADNYEYFAENNAPPTEASGYSFSTPTVAFADQAIGATGTSDTVVMTSTGDQPLTVGTLSAAGDFSVTADTCSGSTLALNATCTFKVTFTPTAAGARTSTISLTGNAYMPTRVLSLSGTGTTPTPAPTPTPTPASAAAPDSGAAPAIRTSTVTAVAAKRMISVTIGPSGGTRTFTVERRVGSAWRALPGSYSTTGSRSVKVPKGTYRVVVAAATGYSAVTSATVTVRR